MFRFLKQWIGLSPLMFLITGCVAPGLGLYQKTLADRQAAYQQALTQRGTYQQSIFSGSRTGQEAPAARLSPEQQEQERQKAEMQRFAEGQKQSKEGAKEVPIGLAQKLLVGTLKGGACNEKISIKINLSGPKTREHHFLKVGGSLQTFDQTGQSDVPMIDTALEGGFDLNTGILGMKAIPKPPPPLTESQISEEVRRRQAMFADFKVRNREFMKAYFKLQKEFSRMTPEERTKASQEHYTQERLLQDEHYSLIKMNMQPIVAQPISPPTPPISLELDIARDVDGRGWAGVVEGDGFNDCHEIVLVSEEGLTTSELPFITGEIAFQRARLRNFARPSMVLQKYWLNIAAKQGKVDSISALGQINEGQGRPAPPDYQRATQIYRSVAKKENAPAPSGPSRMHAKGLKTSTVQAANPFGNVIEKKMLEYGSRDDIVMVIFEAEGNVNSALTNIKAAMRTRDPNGIMNPYWIVNFGDEKVNMKTNCGVIIGQWYSNGFPYREAWENIMDRAIQENAQSGTYLYTQDGEFRVPEKGRSESDTLKKNCFKGSKMAQGNINTLSPRRARDPADELGAAMLLNLIGGSSGVSDAEREREQWQQIKRQQERSW